MVLPLSERTQTHSNRRVVVLLFLLFVFNTHARLSKLKPFPDQQGEVPNTPLFVHTSSGRIITSTAKGLIVPTIKPFGGCFLPKRPLQ